MLPQEPGSEFCFHSNMAISASKVPLSFGGLDNRSPGPVMASVAL